MALYNLPPDLGLGGGAGLHGDEVLQLAKALGEARRVKTAVVNGAASSSPITVTGLAAEDTLQSVVEYAAGVPADRTGVSSIDANGKLVVAATTTGNKLVVTWFDKTA